MPLDLTREITTAFDLAIRRHEAKSLKTGQDWRALQEIEQRHNCARQDTETRYREDYDTRVEKARKDIINERAQLKHEMRGPFGTDKFDGKAIEKLAHRRVRQDHEATMAGIDQSEVFETGELTRKAAERQKAQTQDAPSKTVEQHAEPVRRSFQQS